MSVDGEAFASELINTSEKIERLLVSRNLRGMGDIQSSLAPGYLLRAARLILNRRGKVLILTGFPVADTFETDGPVGAIALYNTLLNLGSEPVLVCEAPLVSALARHYRTQAVYAPGSTVAPGNDALLAQHHPQLIISIERPGMAEDGNYYNMRHENISRHIAAVDHFVRRANCPSIAIGDGGNELGMGNISAQLQQLDITPSATPCSELIVADVSNWGALGLIAMLSNLCEEDFLSQVSPLETLEFLSSHGSVDGVTRLNQLTEDGLPASEGLQLIDQLRTLTGFA